jgi:hypothetical protein
MYFNERSRTAMMLIRRTFVSALATIATIAALGVAAPPAGASTVPVSTGLVPYQSVPALGGPAVGATGNPSTSLGACNNTTGPEGQGAVAGNRPQVCQGAGGLSFIGPSIGQVASVIGPTIIGPAVIGSSIVSAGNASG